MATRTSGSINRRAIASHARSLRGRLSAGLFILLACACTSQARISDNTAGLVLGQDSFSAGGANSINGKGFNQPYNIAMDTNTGRVFVSDTYNHRVLWWNTTSSMLNGDEAAGVVGQATFQGNTGTAGQNRLNRPQGIAVDGYGNLWVADNQNNRVLCFSAPISTSGMNASMVIGWPDYSAAAGSTYINRLYHPYDVAFDTAGNLWVADTWSNRALRFDRPFSTNMNASIVLGSTIFTDRTTGTSQNKMNSPQGITVDSLGNVWVADKGNSRALMFSGSELSNGMNASIVLGKKDFVSNLPNNGPPGMIGCYDLCVDTSGNVWVSDTSNNRVLRFDAPIVSSMNASCALGQPNLTSYALGYEQNRLNSPAGLMIDGTGALWVVEGSISETGNSNHRVTRYGPPFTTGMNADGLAGHEEYDGHGAQGLDGTSMNSPYDTAVDTTTGRIYVSDSYNNRVLWWNNISSLANGQVADGVLGQQSLKYYHKNRDGNDASVNNNTLHTPEGICVDGAGNLWVADSGNNRVLKFEAPVDNDDAAVLALGQQSLTARTVILSAAGLETPFDVAVDSAGNVWVSDYSNSRLLKYEYPITTGEDAVMVLGQQDFTHDGPNAGGASAHSLSYPRGICVDGEGNVWVADYNNSRVLKYLSPAVSGSDASVLLGQSAYNATSGVTSINRLKFPSDVSIDNEGRIWVADTGSSRLLRFNSSTATYQNAGLVVGQSNYSSSAGGSGADRLNAPLGMAEDHYGNLWIADYSNSRIVRFDGYRLSSLSRTEGYNNGTIYQLQLSGYGFYGQPDVKLTRTGFSDMPAADVTVVNENTITCSAALEDKTPGLWNVVVTTWTEISTLKGAFHVRDLFVSITPASGQTYGDVNVELSGDGFVEGTTVMLTKSGEDPVVASNVQVTSPNRLTCTFGLLGKAPGTWDVVVSTGGPGSLTDTLVDGFNVTPIVITSITPEWGNNYRPVAISSITGNGFLSGSVVKLTRDGQADINAEDVAVESLTKITCTFDLRGAATGFWNVSVSSDAFSDTLYNGFEVKKLVTAITPALGYDSGEVEITGIAGDEFLSGSTVKLTKTDQPDIEAADAVVVGRSTMTCAFDLTGKATGYWNLVVSTNGYSDITANAFFLKHAALSGVIPGMGSTYHGPVTVELSGEGFGVVPEVKLTKAGENPVLASVVNRVSSETLTCTFDLTGKAAGLWNVMVVSGSTSSLANAFEVYTPVKTGSGNIGGTVPSAQYSADLEIRGQKYYAVWNENGTLRFNQSSDAGRTWGLPVSIDTGVSGDPAVSCDSSGRIYVVYVKSGTSSCRRSSDNGVSFYEHSVLCTGVTPYPSIDIKDDHVYIANQHQTTGVYLSKTTASSFAFTTTLAAAITNVNPPYLSYGDYRPYLAANESGEKVYIAATGFSGYHYVMFVRSLDYGVNFEERVVINEYYGYRPGIAATGNAVYLTYYADGGGIRLGKSIDSGGSFAFQRVASAGWNVSTTTRDQKTSVATCGDNVMVDWDMHASGDSYTGTRYVLSNDSFATTQGIVSWPAEGSNPYVVFDSSGNGGMVYTVSNGTTYDVCATSASPAVTDLAAVSGYDTGEAKLSWTTPGNAIRSYDIRYSPSLITESNFYAAQQAPNPPQPAAPGTPVSQFSIRVLDPGATYYFAVRSINRFGQGSGLSNSPSAAACTVDVSSPSAITDLAVLGQPFSFRLTWTAPGDNGREYNLVPGGGYILKCSESPIGSEEDFENAETYLQGWTPKPTGQQEMFTLTGFVPGRRYYFAVKSYDDAQNRSPRSNTASEVFTGMSLSDVYPKSGLNTGSRNLILCGTGFDSSMTVRLRRNNKSDVYASSVDVQSGNRAVASFSLSGIDTGIWDLEITRGDESSRLIGQFAVNRPEPPGSGWTWQRDSIACLTVIQASYTDPAVCDIVSGDLDGNGIAELYSSKVKGELRKHTWNGTNWSMTLFADEDNRTDAKLAVGDANNDKKPELYAGCSGMIIQYRYEDQTWSRQVLAVEVASVTYITIGDADNDGQNEVYYLDYANDGANSRLYRLAFTNNAWERSEIPSPYGTWNKYTTIAIGDGDNNGLMELYLEDRTRGLFQIRYDGSAWQTTQIASYNDPNNAHAAVIADGDNNGTTELYVSDNNGIYQYQFNGTTWIKTAGAVNSYYSNEALAACDADNDNVTDIMNVQALAPNTLYLNTGNGIGWTNTSLGAKDVHACMSTVFTKIISADAQGDGYLSLYAMDKGRIVQIKRRAPASGDAYYPTNIYSDAGLGGVNLGYFDKDDSAPWECEVSEDNTTASEGSKSFKLTFNVENVAEHYGGFFLSATSGGNKYDHYYNRGALRFSMKFSSTSVPNDLVIKIRSHTIDSKWNGAEVSLKTYLPAFTTYWQEVAIPLVDFYSMDEGLDFNQMADMFILACLQLGFSGDVWIDDIRWTKPDTIATLNVIPESASMFPGTQKTIIARYYNAAGSIVYPVDKSTWTVTDASVGSVSPAFGDTVVFTATQTAVNGSNCYVVAHASNLTDSTVVTISTKTWPMSYNIYTDGGLPYGADIDVWEENDEPFTVAEVTDGQPPVGLKSERHPIDCGYGGWGVVFSTNLAAYPTRDLSQYDSGELTFYVKTSTGLKVEMESWEADDKTGVVKKSVYLFKDTAHLYGWDGQDNWKNTWIKISIPISEFYAQGVNTRRLHSPFLITAENVAPPQTFEIAHVQLVTNAASSGPSKVQIIDHKMYVNDKEFMVKGVGTVFVPVGYDETYPWWDHPEVYRKDIALMQAMGVNTIRLYNPPPADRADVLTEFYNRGIYCILTYYVYPGANESDFGWVTEENRANLKAGFVSMVRDWMSHPAILAWCIGNEVTMRKFDNATFLSRWYSMVDEFAQAAHDEEAAAGIVYHPVTTAYGEYNTIPYDFNEIGTGVASDANLPHLDFWSLQAYLGKSFGNFFEVYKTKTNKPLLMTEWGCDAYNALTGSEQQQTQSEYDVNLWHEIESTGAVSGHCMGGLLFSWRDAWHKRFTAPNPSVHDTAGDWAGIGYPDWSDNLNMNEEWWGIVAISTDPSYRGLRQAYYSMQSLWRTGSVFSAGLYNRADGSPADKITWSSINLPCDWKAADQYLKIDCGTGVGNWGVQVYTDNCGPQADPRYYVVSPTSSNPAGLVLAGDRNSTLRLCWRVSENELADPAAFTILEKDLADNRTQLYSQKDGDSYPCFIWMKDRNTPDLPAENSTVFSDGEDYVTVCDVNRGIQHAEGTWSQVSMPAYLYIGAKFTNALMPNEYTTNTLTVEFYNE